MDVKKINRLPSFHILFYLALCACSNSIAQSAQGASKDPGNSTRATTRVEAVDILGDPHGADLRSYVESSVFPMIRANWYRLTSKSGEKAGGDATLEFTILKDGSLAATKLTDGAGHMVLGDLAQSAVTKSAPFPALPVEFIGPSLSIRAHFLYEPGISSQGSSVEGQSSLTSPFYANVDGVDGPVYRIVGGISPPRVIHQIDPEFSEEARKKKVSGTVGLSIVVTSKGDVSAVRVTTSLGSGLDEKAIEAVRQWKFKPATKDGEPVSAEIAVIISFNLAKDGTNGR
jgi:TonB family protein